MAYDGNGGFSFPYSWTNDAANGIPITASRMDTQFQNATQGFDLCLTRDGQGAASANLPMNGYKFTGLGTGSALTDSVNLGQVTAGIGALYGFRGGLAFATAGGSSTFGVSVGTATDSTAVQALSLRSAFTKTTAAWAVGTGNGGIDAGTIAASTWYHAYIIGAPAIAPDIIFSTSPSAPTLPTGYTLYRRIFALKTDSSSHWIPCTQYGNRFLWTAGGNDIVTATITTTPSAQVVNVPTGISTIALIRGFMAFPNTGTSAFLLYSIAESAVGSTAAGNAQVTAFVTGLSGGANAAAFTVEVLTTTTQQVFAVVSNNSATSLLTMGAYGWIDAFL